jgi:hypothetical protein
MIDPAASARSFGSRKYLAVPGFLPEPELSLAYEHALLLAVAGRIQPGDDWLPETPSSYGDPLMERLLETLRPSVEAATGLKLLPSYSYFRVYKSRDPLRPHKDRPACEISVSVLLGARGGVPWPLELETPHGQMRVLQRPGDGLIYRGSELTHWRDPFEGEHHAQLFLHYVNETGPHAGLRFDRRAGLSSDALHENPSGMRGLDAFDTALFRRVAGISCLTADRVRSLPPAREFQFALNRSADAIFQLCDGTRTIAEISRAIARRMGLKPELFLGDVRSVVLRMHQLGLVDVAVGAAGRAPYVQIEDLFARHEVSQLLSYVAARKGDFTPSLAGGRYNVSARRSNVLYDFPPFSRLIVDLVRETVSRVLPLLGVRPFAVGAVEAQLTAHHDGDYFTPHTDSGTADTASRKITYVYYFHRQPRRYRGGDLDLFPDSPHHCRIEPKCNSIVFFPSDYLHRVSPVVCKSRHFVDGRFTVNGWIHKL